MNQITIGYLGPEGTFTHQAAQAVAAQLLPSVEEGWFPNGDNPVSKPSGQTLRTRQLLPFDSVAQVFFALENGQIDYGVAALDNTVEGPVFATIDGLLNSSEVIALWYGEWLPVTFDAYALAETAKSGQFEVGTAHPHALAQVSQALARFNVIPQPAASNGAAIQNLAAGQIAFGPPGHSGENIVTIAENVGDFSDAKTQFVLLATRERAAKLLPIWQHDVANPQSIQTLLAVTPGAKGPGVLARITSKFAGRDLNLSSLISRPIRGQAGSYVFVVTVDAAPWEPTMRALLTDLLADDDAVKTLGIWQGQPPTEPDQVEPPKLIPPPGSASGADPAAALQRSLLW